MFLTTTGLVLREAGYRESDKILTVLTRDEGKLTVKARGAAKKGSRYGAAAQIFCFSEMTLFGNKGRWSLNEAQTLEQFMGLREDIGVLALAAYFAQLLESVSDEECPNSDLLRLGLNSFFALSRGYPGQELIKAAFEMRLMCLAGYEPLLDRCIICGGVSPDNPHFSFEAGGILCDSCGKDKDGKRDRLNLSQLLALRHIVFSDLKRIFSFSLDAQDLKDLGKTTADYLTAQLERGFSTLDYWNKIKNC